MLSWNQTTQPQGKKVNQVSILHDQTEITSCGIQYQTEHDTTNVCNIFG